MLQKIFWISIVTFSYSISVIGQSYGGNKWSQKWQQLSNDDIRVIFPEGFETQAQGVFSLLDYLNQNARESIGLRTDKVSMVLNNLTNISNGYVGLAPFRSELFTTPTQNSFTLGSLPWLDLLTVHEYRHVLQFSNARRGLSKILSVAFGESAFAGAINLAIPDWYFEGDAVLAETAMSPQGRGRIPHFLRAFKAYEAAGRRFSYQKVRNGSFKHFIPDHYRIGYMISKYGADQYGTTFWGEVLADAGAYKGLFYPFSKAIKSRTGHNTKSLYEATLDHYKSAWNQPKKKKTIGQELFYSRDRVFTNYRFPTYDNQGKLYFVKGSLNSVNAVWTQSVNGSKKLFTLGLSNDIYIDINGGKISWSELRFHPSRGNIDYSVAMSYDIETGEKHQISFLSRYASPTTHPDGKIMAVVDINELGDTQLKIISIRDGLVIDSLTNNSGYFITYPKWNANGTELYFAARDTKGQMAICHQVLGSDDVSVISSWSFYPIGVPHITASHIYYSQSADDAEHIYRVSLDDGIQEMIVNSEFGAYQPFLLGNEVAYSSFTADGLRLQKNTINPTPISTTSNIAKVDRTYKGYGGNVLSKVSPAPKSAPKKYGRLSRAINLHSWGITADDQSASLLIQSDNVFNSVSLSGGLQYLFNDDRSIWTAGASFGFIYPNLTTRLTKESRKAIVEIDGQREHISFDDYNISLGLEAPLNFSSGPYLRSLLPYYAVEKRLFEVKDERVADVDFLSHRMGLIFSNRRLRSPQEILSSYSQFVSLSYQGTLDDQDGRQFNLESEFTFPGVLKNHVIRLETDYNSQDGGLYSNRFDSARGYPDIPANKSFKVGVNYHLPVLYPDFGIGGIAYLKRIQANLFYDYSRLSGEQNTFDFSSTGVELIFDANILNTLPLSFGVRYARTIEIEDNVIEFFVPFYRF